MRTANLHCQVDLLLSMASLRSPTTHKIRGVRRNIGRVPSLLMMSCWLLLNVNMKGIFPSASSSPPSLWEVINSENAIIIWGDRLPVLTGTGLRGSLWIKPGKLSPSIKIQPSNRIQTHRTRRKEEVWFVSAANVAPGVLHVLGQILDQVLGVTQGWVSRLNFSAPLCSYSSKSEMRNVHFQKTLM